MSAVAAKKSPRALGAAGFLVFATGVLAKSWVAALVVLVAFLGAPLFAVMGGASELAWLRHPDEAYHHLRFIAPRVLDDHFAGSAILVTIPLFTFVGYVLARAKTAQRLVRFSTALVGWIPGGLAIVCVVTSAVFTLLTGGSGVTIIAIGGLLYPALKKEGYSEKFSLGLLTSGGSLGLLLPFSLPLLVYSLVAGVDTNAASVAVLAPGLLVLVLFVAYTVYVGVVEKVPRKPFDGREVLAAGWDLKWELLIPVIMGVGIVKLGLPIDECAGLVAFYTVMIECFVYRDFSFKKDLPKIAVSGMAMAGAVIMILTMANALVNYVIQEKIPDFVLTSLVDLGLDKTWQFLLVMNLFLLALGMVMEGFSAIFVAVPLILPFAARFHLGPFHVGMIFLLNLELAYCTPPLGLNLFIASFRFHRPVTSLYRPILPFLGILLTALLIVSYVPGLSNVMIRGQIADLRAKAVAAGEAPRDAWLLECVQEDRLNPLPCTDDERLKYPGGKVPVVEAPTPVTPEVVDAGASPDDLEKMMMGEGPADAAAATDGASVEDLELLMMGGAADSGLDAGRDAGADGGDAGKKKLTKQEEVDDLTRQMMGD